MKRLISIVLLVAVGCANDPHVRSRSADGHRGRLQDDGSRWRRSSAKRRIHVPIKPETRRTRRRAVQSCSRRADPASMCRTYQVERLSTCRSSGRSRTSTRMPGQFAIELNGANEFFVVRPVDDHARSGRRRGAADARPRRATSRSTSRRNGEVDGVFREDQLARGRDRSRPDHARQRQPVRARR